MVLDAQTFDYALHNGFEPHHGQHRSGCITWQDRSSKAGDRPISRVGAGVLLPHAENTILGTTNQVGPKNERVCCTGRDDWWQINGWTAGGGSGCALPCLQVHVPGTHAENRVRRAESRTGVPGSADQSIWMSEQVLSVGSLF